MALRPRTMPAAASSTHGGSINAATVSSSSKLRQPTGSSGQRRRLITSTSQGECSLTRDASRRVAARKQYSGIITAPPAIPPSPSGSARVLDVARRFIAESRQAEKQQDMLSLKSNNRRRSARLHAQRHRLSGSSAPLCEATHDVCAECQSLHDQSHAQVHELCAKHAEEARQSIDTEWKPYSLRSFEITPGGSRCTPVKRSAVFDAYTDVPIHQPHYIVDSLLTRISVPTHAVLEREHNRRAEEDSARSKAPKDSVALRDHVDTQWKYNLPHKKRKHNADTLHIDKIAPSNEPHKMTYEQVMSGGDYTKLYASLRLPHSEHLGANHPSYSTGSTYITDENVHDLVALSGEQVRLHPPVDIYSLPVAPFASSVLQSDKNTHGRAANKRIKRTRRSFV